MLARDISIKLIVHGLISAFEFSAILAMFKYILYSCSFPKSSFAIIRFISSHPTKRLNPKHTIRKSATMADQAVIHDTNFINPCTTNYCSFCSLPIRPGEDIHAINIETGARTPDAFQIRLCMPGCDHPDGFGRAIHHLCSVGSEGPSNEMCRISSPDYRLNEIDEFEYEQAVALEFSKTHPAGDEILDFEQWQLRRFLKYRTAEVVLTYQANRYGGEIDFHHKVYATYQMFHSHKFVATLSNSETEGSTVIYCPPQLLSPPGQPETVVRVFIVRNQLGVLDIYPCTNGDEEIIRDADSVTC